MKRLRILTLCSLIVSIAVFSLKKGRPTTIAIGDGLVIKKDWLAINKTPVTPTKDVRPADQTFLTFPEWYLVFSPEEQAHYFKKFTATSFPFTSHIKQIWQSYKIVNEQIKDNFPINKGYHFMIWVIGSSASVEYAIKALYETIIGRITDTHRVCTAEDKFNAKFTQDYVDFIKDHPWYEFDFKSRLNVLWCNTPFWDDHFLRKMERRYILTSELLVKIGYGKLIGLGTKTVYDEAGSTTAVVVYNLSAKRLQKGLSRIYADGSALVYLPRYDQFNRAVSDLAKQGVVFKEIAGNTSAILLTVLLPFEDTTSFPETQTIFIQPISSELSMKRVVLAVPVKDLSKVLAQFNNSHIITEHVFDY